MAKKRPKKTKKSPSYVSVGGALALVTATILFFGILDSCAKHHEPQPPVKQHQKK